MDHQHRFTTALQHPGYTEPRASVAEAIETLQGQHDIWVASIGDEAVPLSTRLEDGMALDFFPHLEGG